MVIAIVGGVLNDGTGRMPGPNRGILVEDGMIADTDIGRVPSSVDRTIDATGLTILPGLIDCHVHLAAGHVFSDTGEPEPKKAPSYELLRAAYYCRLAIDAGITTVRDLGSNLPGGLFPLRQAIDDRLLPGPRLLLAGCGISMTGGQGYYDESVEADGVEEVRKAVRAQLRSGADVIKLFATGGVGTPTGGSVIPQLTLEELSVAVEEAHRAGKQAVAHAHGREGIRNALAAGVDCLVHGIMLDQDAIRVMVERGVFLEPTLSVYSRILEAPEGVPRSMVEKTKKIHASHRESVRSAIKAGVKVILGTDSGSPYHLHPQSLLRELEIFVEEGMTPLEALRAATGLAAEGIGRGNDLGTIERGRVADIIAVERELYGDLDGLRRVKWVMKGGELVRE